MSSRPIEGPHGDYGPLPCHCPECRLKLDRAIEPDTRIRAVKVDHITAAGLQRVKIQMDSGAWLYADVPTSAILNTNGGP